MLFTAATCITAAHADPVTLTFNLPDLVPNVPVEIDGYYSGGTDALGAVGPNYGIAFQPLTGVSIVLEQETELEPTEIMTDTGAYTDVIFGTVILRIR